MSQELPLNSQSKKSKVRPLTKEEIHETAIERVHLIAKEFTDGFNFLQNYPKSVTVFGGTRFPENSSYYIKARELCGRIASDLGYSIFTGGGPGIMEAANRGAFEVGGASLGLTIELPAHQKENKFLTNSLDFYYFFSRKVCMSFSAEAYIFFPGGFGTLDEFFEIITLVQTGKIEKVPMILVGADFWTPLHELMKKELLGRDTIGPDDLNLYTITDDVDMIINLIKKVPIRNGLAFNHSEFEKSGIEIIPSGQNTF